MFSKRPYFTFSSSDLYLTANRMDHVRESEICSDTCPQPALVDQEETEIKNTNTGVGRFSVGGDDLDVRIAKRVKSTIRRLKEISETPCDRSRFETRGNELTRARGTIRGRTMNPSFSEGAVTSNWWLRDSVSRIEWVRMEIETDFIII
ncbi:hypothetical protein TNIN_69331 [Trichonephila inaurata madagascariensis]|uniref:Uncharacterized protein n=1 Tax=Trichonephila inaurata madagascariensis TaxID=2747483 RepID=A0A8X6XCQ4_9ARAC|nr:hypothetical protein TNIN_69331 [Trichonephila inaurata madagascariensis]